MNHEVFITTDCNLSCRYCFIKNNIDHYKSMVIESCTDLDKLDIKPGDTVEFLGGEPMLRRELLIQCIDYLTDIRNLLPRDKIIVTTNGTIYDKKIVDRGVSICVSLDGDAPINNMNRGMYSIVKNNLYLLKPKCIHMVVTMNNVDFFYKSYLHILSLGFPVSFGLDYRSLDRNEDLFIAILYQELNKISDYCIKRHINRPAPFDRLHKPNDSVSDLMDLIIYNIDWKGVINEI